METSHSCLCSSLALKCWSQRLNLTGGECGLIGITVIYSSMISNIDRRGRGVCKVSRWDAWGKHLCAMLSLNFSMFEGFFFLTLKRWQSVQEIRTRHQLDYASLLKLSPLYKGTLLKIIIGSICQTCISHRASIKAMALAVYLVMLRFCTTATVFTLRTNNWMLGKSCSHWFYAELVIFFPLWPRRTLSKLQMKNHYYYSHFEKSPQNKE